MKSTKKAWKSKNSDQTLDKSTNAYAISFGKNSIKRDSFKTLHRNMYK